MKTRTLKALNTWDAMNEAFALLNKKHRVLESNDAAALSRYNVMCCPKATDEAVKLYRCMACGAEFFLMRSIIGSSRAHAAGENKFQVRAGAHAVHSDADCAEGLAPKVVTS